MKYCIISLIFCRCITATNMGLCCTNLSSSDPNFVKIASKYRGCMERRSGIIGVAAIDLIIHVFCMITVQQWPDSNGTLGGRFIFLACLDDIILLIAVGTFNGCLIVFWKVVRMLYILTLFIIFLFNLHDDTSE